MERESDLLYSGVDVLRNPNIERSEVLFQQLLDQRSGEPIGESIVKRFMSEEITGALVGGVPGSGKTTIATGLAHAYPYTQLMFFDRELRVAEGMDQMGPRDSWTARDWRSFTKAYVGDKMDRLSEILAPEQKLIVEVPILGVTDRGVSPAKDIAGRSEGARNRNNTLILILVADPRIHDRAKEMREIIPNVDDGRVLSFLEKRYNTLITNASDFPRAEAGRRVKEILARTSPPQQVGDVDSEKLDEIRENFLNEGIVPEGKDRVSEEEETELMAARYREQLVGHLESTPIPPQAQLLSPKEQKKIRNQFYVAEIHRIMWNAPQENWIVAFNEFRVDQMHYLDLGLHSI